MINVQRNLLPVAVMSLFLSACASNGPAPVVDLNQPSAISISPQAVVSPQVTQPSANSDVVVSALGDGGETPNRLDEGPNNNAVVNDQNVATQDQNPAVVALLNRANQSQRKGDYVRSAASLERALKIEPNNAWLWYRLAEVRLQQGQVGQAASLAAKSNSLIGAGAGTSQRQIMAKNWLLIAKVHTLRGEHIAARAAVAKANRIMPGAG